MSIFIRYVTFKKEGGGFMKKTMIFFAILSVLVLLVACEESTQQDYVDFEEYDTTDLSNCMGQMLDDDEETICTQEDGEALLLAYATHFAQYIDPQVENISVHLFYNQMTGIEMFVQYDDVPTSMSYNEIDTMNKIVEEINTDIENIFINDLNLVLSFRPNIIFRGEEISGIFDMDVPAFTYRIVEGDTTYYSADLRVYEDISLTENFNERLNQLDEVKGLDGANRFAIRVSNGAEYVQVILDDITSEVSILVDVEGQQGTTSHTISDFLSDIETRYPSYTYIE